MDDLDDFRPARRSSGIYGNYDEPSHASSTSLAGHAAFPAGSRFSEGDHAIRVTTSDVAVGAGAVPIKTQGFRSRLSTRNSEKTAPLSTAATPVPFYKKRKFIISQLIMIPLGIALLFILLFPVVKAIVQLVVNRSYLNVDVATISATQNYTFQLGLQGSVSHTGIFPAKIEFTKPANVSWIEDDKTHTPLGYMSLSTISAKNKHAVINQTSSFMITDQDAFGRFTKFMITAPTFTWKLTSNSLRVQALKFPVANGINFDKDITLKGINSFSGNIVLQDLQLPNDNPQGGINFVAVTQLTNPSPFSLNLGTVVFDLAYGNTSLGSGSAFNTAIAPGPNVINLSGVLQRQNSPSDLAAISQLFTNYINGDSSPVVATGKSTMQPDNSTVSWLSEGIQALKLDVPFKPLAPIDPIQSISIGQFDLAFTPESAWSPRVQSHTVQAALSLPFGFNISIGQIQNNFNLTKNDLYLGGLSTPMGASTSDITVYGSTNTSGTINITIDGILDCPIDDHPNFSSFNTDLTTLPEADFRLVGNSSAVANMSIGQITLNPIKVNVSTSLLGLKGLNGMTTIEKVDVMGGSTDAINLDITVSIYNPSNLNLATGDLTLQLFREGAVLGTALLPNLTLAMGNNTVLASSQFQANNNPLGAQTLDDFVGKKDVALSIAGYSGSTQVASLLQAFESLNISVTLPGLKTNLLSTASFEVLPTTGVNNITHVTVDLVNPFTAALKIVQILSTVSYEGISLGSINSNAGFSAAGKSTTTSPALDLVMNFDPAALFTITRSLAVKAGLDVGPLDAIVSLGGIQYLSTSNGNATASSRRRRANEFSGFNLPSFVDTAFKKLESDVQLSTSVDIGDYQTTLQYTQTSVPTHTDASLNLILPVLAQPIVQKLVSGSVLGIDTVLITNPQQHSFGTTLKGSITKAGPFDATISFPSGLTVSWAGKPIGNLKMADVKLVGDVGATIDTESTFEVLDVDQLTAFTKTLLTEESFDWTITGENLTVSALGIDVPGISLTSKTVTLKGFNGLKGGVTIKSFDLPSNDPQGGIHLTIQATTTNPSQVGVQLSSIAFNTFVGDVMIAPVASTGELTLAPGTTSPLSLAGRLVPQSSAEGLAAVSSVFNNFIHGQNSDVVVQGVSAGPSDVTWLNEGIKSLQIATVLPNQGPLNIIKSIDLNQLTMMFTDATAYNPATSSSSTTAAFDLPFAFPVDITALEQNISVAFQGKAFAVLALPKAPSTTDVETRVITLTFSNVPFAVQDGQQSVFDSFIAATTVGTTETIHLSGAANADAKTAVGVLSLSGIEFAVDTSIKGLQGLNAKPVTVSNLDVNHGFPDFLQITVNTDLFDPSNLTIGTGDVSFSLQFEDQTIGSADLNNLIIKPGNASYPTDVKYAPQGAAVAAGRDLLQNFLQGVNSETTILGTTGSTPIQSLKSALSQIKLSPVTIPALHQNLITSTSLTFPVDIVKTGVATASFALSNPFTASINLLEVGAIATFHGINLGVINHVDVSSSPIHAAGHSNITSPGMPLNFNLNPVNIIQLLSTLAQENHVDLGPLVQLFQVILNNPNAKTSVTTTVDTSPPTCSSGHQFDVDGAILRALAGLRVDLAVDSNVKLDDYATELTFNQSGVPAITDRTALFLIGAVSAPVAQVLVDGASLAFTEANITNLSNEGFDLSLRGSLTNVGPLDALITFVEPVTVTWQSQNIATIALPPVCAAANTGVPDYSPNAHLTITDQSAFTSFATFLLHNPSFDWTISTPKLRVTALGTIFDNVSLSKKVTFKAFNGLPGVTINNFKLPSDDPAGGIHIETGAIIPSQAQLGIDLGTVGFQAYFQNTLVGPLSASNLALAASSTTQTQLVGRIVPQSGSDLNTIGSLFSQFLAGDNITLTAKGDSVQPTGSTQPVTWLSTAFQTLSLDVILPGQKLQVIQSIALSDLTVTMQTQDQAFTPLASSKFTLAQYKNPFGFSLQVTEASEDIILSSGGTDIAELKLARAAASGGVSTGNLVDLDISFENQPLKSLNDGAFELMFAAVTLKPTVDLQLKGTADVTARTTIGDVPISGIPFDVPSSLKGINAFGGTASLSNISVTGSGGNGGNQFIVSPLTTTLHNPSNISLETVDIALPVIFKDVVVGRAAINPFNLNTGDNVIPTEFHYEPQDANDTVAQSFLTEFLQGNSPIPLSIKGDSGSTPFGSLQPALEGLQLSTSLPGMNVPPLITHITVTITLDTLVTNLVSVNFDFFNPLPVDLVIEFVQSDASVGGTIFSHFDQAFTNFVIPAGQTANSGEFGNVLLTKGAFASLGIIPLGYLDLAAASTTLLGVGGYRVPWLQITQNHVPTTYNVALSAHASPPSAHSSSAAASHAASSSTLVSSTNSSPLTESSESVKPSSTTTSSEPTTTGP